MLEYDCDLWSAIPKRPTCKLEYAMKASGALSKSNMLAFTIYAL